MRELTSAVAVGVANVCPPCHWRIDEQSGPTSTGRCQKCGQEKIFKNFHSAVDIQVTMGPSWLELNYG